MSRKSTVTKAVVKLEGKSGAENMEGVHKAIETGLVDVQTIAILRKLLSPSVTATASITISSTAKSPLLASARAKKTTRTTERITSTTTIAASNPFPGNELVCGTKTIIMKSLHVLGSEVETRTKASESTPASVDAKSLKQNPSQGIRNVLTCCKFALEALRQWQDHQDIGSSWVNKAYFGYISKLIALEMPETAVKELTSLKTEIESQLQLTAPSKKLSAAAKKKLQASTKQNLPAASAPTFDPLPLMLMNSTHETDDEESVTLICAYLNHVLRAIGAKSKFEADQPFIAALEANGGPIFWINKLPSTQTSHHIDNFSRALIKIAHNTKSPETQLSLRTLRYRLAITQSSANVDSIAKSTHQAVRSYYAATKSDKEAYTICKDVISPILESLISTAEGAKVVNFMGLIARKAGLLADAMKWNDLGLRKCSAAETYINALYLLRNAGILFTLTKEDLDCMEDDVVQDRLKYTANCLASFEKFYASASESLRDELDYLRRTILSTKSEILQSSPPLKEARANFPRKILRAFVNLADLNSSLIPKLSIPVRTLISDILTSLRDNFSPLSPPQNYLSILDLCQKAAFKIQDNQALQYTGNQYFNFGTAFQKAGKRKEAKNVLERSLELDFSPIVSEGEPEQSEEEKNRAMTVRCRKLEMLGECCGKGEEKDAFALILEALNVHIGSLNLVDEVAEMSLGRLMKKEEYLTRLIGCVTKFTRESSDWSPGEVPAMEDEFEITLSDTTPLEVKAFVYEVQVQILLGMTYKGREACARKIAQKALQIYKETNCPLRGVRIVERLLYLSVLDGEDVQDILNLGSGAIANLTSTKTFGKDEGLQGSQKLILARCLAWMCLLSDSTDTPKQGFFSQALAIWSRWSDKALHEPREEDKTELVEVTRILELLSDFFEVKSLSLLRIQSLHLLLRIQSHLNTSLDILIPLYASLAVQYLRLGYTGKAGTLFAQGLKQMQNSAPSNSTQLQWHLHYAEYYARIGVIAKANSHISQAGEIYTQEFSSPKKRLDPKERAQRILAVGRAGYVLSLVAFEGNELEKAIGYIDYSIRVLKTGIASVERSSTRAAKASSPDYDPFSSEKKPMLEKANVDNGGIQIGSKLWAYKSAFFTALLQHGILLTFRGSAREGEFWFRQAYDAAKSIKARNSIVLSSLHLGDLFTRMSSLPIAHEFLCEAADLAEAVEKTKDGVVLEMSLFGLHGRKDVWSDAFISIVRAETKLKKLLEPSFVNGLEKGEGMDLVERFGSLRISLGSPAGKTTARSPKTSRRQIAKASNNVFRAEYESVTFSRMQLTIAENKAYSLARQRRFEEGYLAMDGLPGNEKLVLETLSARITKARMLLLEVYQLLESDPLLCVLSESAISIPSVHGKPITAESETKTPRGKRGRQKSGNKMLQFTSRFRSLLIEARVMIESIFERACTLCPSTLAPVVGLLMGEARLLSSIVGESEMDQNLLALKTIMLLDRSRSVMYRREQAALEFQAKQNHLSLTDVEWPEQTSRPDSEDEDLTDMLTSLSVSANKRALPTTAEEIIHGLPVGCTVVSINLSESKEHFIVSKVHPQGCVVVRLPLLKHPPEAEEEPFTFATAYEELSEIIRLNNESAQAAKDAPDRAAKEVWWTTRKELDARLSLFLQNMETCWIGGFTGMFRGFFQNDDVFTKFRMAFRQILVKFLPSRKEGDIQMELDPRLIDLFLSLTTENKDETDVADQVEDLICFALDNFKFHGEQIAIDEVDLDAMTIDIQEAIRCYHEAVTPKKQDHVILILDKALHTFPWESLPCLRGRSVSRLPSLGTLIERVVASPIEGASWPSVMVNRGFFVLNPSGDLTHTQSQFEPTLSKIDGWNGIVGRAPMDQEILSALRNNDIFLYFGHGSGEQYVKSAQIKRLQNSALTMLFGCSSGKLREAGDFEAWGTPITYLLGGSPAVLANLWDVTDRDIDRLSYGVFSRWGLCEGERPKSRGSDDGQFEPERGMGLDFGGGSIGERKRQLQASIRGKKYVATRKGVSLTEALAMAREDCTLKYLNGAAPVIYGVPVFLEERK